MYIPVSVLLSDVAISVFGVVFSPFCDIVTVVVPKSVTDIKTIIHFWLKYHVTIYIFVNSIITFALVPAQFSSSLPSEQSGDASHAQVKGMHGEDGLQFVSPG